MQHSEKWYLHNEADLETEITLDFYNHALRFVILLIN